MDRAVARGAAVLDQVRPGWEDLIRLGSLDISNPYNCVVAQVFEKEWANRKSKLGEESPYRFGFSLLKAECGFAFKLEASTLGASYFGFAGGWGVTQAWRELVIKRRLEKSKAAGSSAVPSQVLA